MMHRKLDGLCLIAEFLIFLAGLFAGVIRSIFRRIAGHLPPH